MHFYNGDGESADEDTEEESEHDKTPKTIFNVADKKGGFESVSQKMQASISSKLIQKMETSQIMKKDMNTVANQEMISDAKFNYLKEIKASHTMLKPILGP